MLVMKIGKLNPNAVDQSNDKKIEVYNNRTSCKLNTDAAGVADNKDIRVYHHIQEHIQRDTYRGTCT